MKRYIVLCLICLAAGCATDKPSTARPYDQFLDPVTERTPDVIIH